MIQTLLLLLFLGGGLYAVLHFFTELSHKAKLLVLATLLGLSLAATFYEHQNNLEREKMRAMTLRFEHGQSIVCDDINVTKEGFNINSRTFVGKPSTPYFGQLFLMTNCHP